MAWKDNLESSVKTVSVNVSGSLIERHPDSSQRKCTNELSKKIAVVIALSKQEKDGVDVSKEGNGRAMNMLLSLQ